MSSNDEEINRLIKERGVSNWLKNALKAALQRDSADAANDAEVLFRVLDQRAIEALHKSFGFTGQQAR